MAQATDYTIANSTGANVRADINTVLEAIATNNSGSSAPSNTQPTQFFADTSAGILKLRNTANSGYVNLFTLAGGVDVDAASNFNEDVTFTGASANIVFDKSDNALEFADSAKAKFGTDGDLEIFHTSLNDFIQSSGAGFFIDTNNTLSLRKVTGEIKGKFIGDGAVELYFDNSKKFETLTDGVNITGTLKVNGSAFSAGIASVVADTSPQLGGNLDCNDKNIIIGDSSSGSNNRIRIGDSNDLELFHNGTNSVITNANGQLILQAAAANVSIEPKYGEKALVSIPNGAVELYFDNNKKFETLTGGAKVSGNLLVQGDILLDSDTEKLKIGVGEDLQLFHDGSNSFIKDAGTGSLVLNTNALFINNAANTENMISAGENGNVELYFDNVKQVETIGAGLKITSGHGAGLEIENPGTNLAAQFKLKNTTVGKQYTLGVAGNTGANGQNSSLIFRDETANITRLEINTSGNLLPGQNNAYDLGSSGRKWANLFTNDIHLSNEGSANDVDGTWGSYNIQEGAEDLFLINKRSGKKYKFALTEVS